MTKNINQDNILSLKILLPNNEVAIIDDKKVAKVQEFPDLIPFFTELVTYHTDFDTGQVKSLPTIYGITKTKKCVRQLKDLRIMRSKRSRRVSQYVLMDGVYFISGNPPQHKYNTSYDGVWEDSNENT